jgi:hypothetical protein
MPISSKTMSICNHACNGDYQKDDIRCCIFVFVPCTFVIDLLCVCPRCTINCCKEIKEKKFGQNVKKIIITSQPQPIQLPEPAYVYSQHKATTVAK